MATRPVLHARPCREDAGPSVAERRGPERGVTLIETAMAVPIFFLLLFGLVDLGSVVFQTSQASSAAADGARAGIVLSNLSGADTKSGAAYTTIFNAVKKKVVSKEGTLVTSSDVDVMCLDADDKSISCSTAGTNRDHNKVRVTVRWQYDPISFVGAAIPVKTVKGSTTMALIVLPDGLVTTTTTTTPGP